MASVDPTILGQYVSTASGCFRSSFFPTTLEPCLKRSRFGIRRRVGRGIVPMLVVDLTAHQSLIGG